MAENPQTVFTLFPRYTLAADVRELTDELSAVFFEGRAANNFEKFQRILIETHSARVREHGQDYICGYFSLSLINYLIVEEDCATFEALFGDGSGPLCYLFIHTVVALGTPGFCHIFPCSDEDPTEYGEPIEHDAIVLAGNIIPVRTKPEDGSSSMATRVKFYTEYQKKIHNSIMTLRDRNWRSYYRIRAALSATCVFNLPPVQEPEIHSASLAGSPELETAEDQESISRLVTHVGLVFAGMMAVGAYTWYKNHFEQ